MSADLSALRLLLVDDNQHMRSIVRQLFKGVGLHDIKEASNGAEALQILRGWTPDFAIVDYQMEPLDGVQFTELVRKSPDSKVPYLPIIMLTAYADKRRVFEARDAGVNEVVVKPITASQLFSRMNAVIYKPRPFVRVPDDGYFGPERRRISDPNYDGPKRRAEEQPAVEI
jgi:two-component system, chemotaxis family, chemotaxis protein CheY